MLGTSTIQQYFATGSSHYVLPQTSFEWNYNLFYAPYATTNSGSTAIIFTSSWSNAPTVVPKGRITSVFLADAGQTTRSCSSFNTTTGSGDSSLTINISNIANTYKIVFWAKVDRDASVNLSALAYIDYHRAHSVSKTIDSVNWTKFEVYLSPQPTGASYSNPVLSLHYGSTDSTTSFGILIDQIEMYQTSDFEYRYGNLWTTSSVFDAFRPGESFVSSGNSLCQLPTDFRKIKTNLGFTSGAWNNQIMPISPVVYHPTLMGTNAFNPLFKNGSLSEWNRYKYFVADAANPEISAIYDQRLNVNKIVIKFNLSYSTPSSFTVSMSGKTQTKAGGNNYTYSYNGTFSNADIDSSGTCILYYQSSGSWISAKNGGAWTGTVDTTTTPGTPSFDFNGNIKFGGSKGGTVNATVAINSIDIVQNSATVNSAYGSYTNVDENMSGGTTKVDRISEFKRMQIIEVSPRLEVDLSYYTMSVETQAEMDNKMNPLPISAISSNMATITLSNIPLTVSNNVLSLFSNNSSNSILKGLFRNYVKCYVNYRIIDNVAGSSSTDRVVPGGVFYVDTWDVSDITQTVVTAYDISKYLQLLQPTDYVSQTEDVFRLISNILDFAGFTDYNYDELKRVTTQQTTLVDGTIKKTTAPIKIRYFYVDGTQQKVFDVLREIFEAYQIAAYVDAYGIMRFINVDGIFDPSNPINMQLHDSTTPVSVTTANGYSNNLSITTNIVEDTYKENTKTKLGKATFTYKTPQIVKTIVADTRLQNSDQFVDYAPTYMDSTDTIWDLTTDEVMTYNTLDSTMGLSDTYFTIPTAEAIGASTAAPVFRTIGVDHDGYGLIENEIVSFKYKEVSYVGPTVNTKRSVANSSEWASRYAEISNLAGLQGFKVQATGKITNVDRGQFNTPVSSHIVMSTLSDIQQKFDTTNAASKVSIINKTIGLTAGANSISSITCLDSYSTGGSTNTYNTFSARILAGGNSGTKYADGTRYGLILHNSSQTPSVYVSITEKTVSGVKKYLLDINSGSYTGPSLLTAGTNPKDITSIINKDASTYPTNSPFEDYGKYINLKFVKGSGGTNSFEIYINKTNVNLSTQKSLTLDTSGKFGVFTVGGTSATSTVQFSEVYATQTALLDAKILYHHQLPWFIEKIASNKKIFEISYIVQSAPVIIGINYYDVQDIYSPSIDAYPLRIGYDWYYYLNGNAPDTTSNKISLPYIPVNEDSLSYSPVYHSGFRSRFAIINCSPSQVWIRKSPDSVNKINVDFSILTKSLITLGPDIVKEKIFDISNINETVDITSSWVQDGETADNILRTIYRGLDGFSRDTQISVYGNPLYEIGDIVVINYGLKGIVNQKYFVQGITQTFDTGLTTLLTLNEIG